MGALEEFIDEYNVIVVNEETTAFFQVINAGTDEVWHTFPTPADAQKIQASISNLGYELPTGRHSIRVQAISQNSGAIRGQVAQTVEGRSAAAKGAMSDALTAAKATQMNIQTADTQLISMSARLQAADERAREAEARAGEMISEVYKMGDMVNKFIMERESAIFDREEREARSKSMMMIAETMAPLLAPVITIAVKFAEMHVQDKDEEMQSKMRARRAEREAKEQTVSYSAPPTVVDVQAETTN